MYSKNSGASWSIVAQNVHSRYYSNYSKYDFTWSVIVDMHTVVDTKSFHFVCISYHLEFYNLTRRCTSLTMQV